MTSKERVLKAINGEKTDRVPIFMWYNAAVKKKLAQHLGIKPDEVEKTLCNDVYQDWLSINLQMTTPCEEGKTFTDEWGITWKREGEYNTAVTHPLDKLSSGEIADYPFPDADKEERYAKLRRLISYNSDKAFIGADVSGSLFEPAYHLRGMENLLCDMMTGEEAADVLLDKLKNFTMRVACNALALGADWIWLGDDFGTQQSLIASPELWRAYFKPRLKEIIDALKAIKPDVIVAYHSCGSIYPLIGDLYEVGVRVLNPIQESAAGMDQQIIRDNFPLLTMFCGLDTQQYLVKATPEEVYVSSKEKIKRLGSRGRYIFGCSHTIQHDVPVENIIAMIRAAKDDANG